MYKLFALSALALTVTPTFASADSCASSIEVAKADDAPKTIVETAVAAGSFKTLAAALGAAELVDALNGEGSFTVFAPTDAAFAQLPKETLQSLLKPENRGKLRSILTYHVVPGEVLAADVVSLTAATTLNGQRFGIEVSEEGVRVAGANVTSTDIRCSNGVIHVIDSVILPADKNIVETAASSDMFETLVAAVGAAGLAEALQGEGPFTVLAPTDDAFAALPEGTVQSLLKPENRDRLVAILKYHVIPGRVFSDQAAGLSEAATLEGSMVSISPKGKTLLFNRATVIKADLQASNGVVHVIDQVLIPASN